MHAGQRITLLKIDEMLAMCHRYELQVTRPMPEPFEHVGYHKVPRMAVVKQRGKRKESWLDMKPDDILLDGWDVPFKTDTECSGVFSGNACYNLVGEPAAIRECLETRALVPLSDSCKAKIFVMRGPRTSCDDSGVELLYPDLETYHAVVNRFKERNEVEPDVVTEA